MSETRRTTSPTQFRAKRWIHFAQAFGAGTRAVFGLGFGPLCVFGYHKRVDGTSASDAGVPLILVGVACSGLFGLAVFNILARRRPLLSLCREGIEFTEIGRSSLDRIPFVPRLIRIAWPVVSGQGFRFQLICIPWRSYRGTWVSGRPWPAC